MEAFKLIDKQSEKWSGIACVNNLGGEPINCLPKLNVRALRVCHCCLEYWIILLIKKVIYQKFGDQMVAQSRACLLRPSQCSCNCFQIGCPVPCAGQFLQGR